ncbi:MAG: amidohydrolase family protein [Gemmatimonadaceae bacterium]
MRTLPMMLLALLLLAPCQAAPQSTSTTAVAVLITHTTIIDVRSGARLRDRTIAIAGDSIVAITGSAEARQFSADRVVDGTGTFAIPGLWDMHVHFGGGDSLIHENRNLLPLYVAHGVTAVRDAAGDLASTVLAWRDSIARGEMSGPQIFTSGPKLEGLNSIWPGDLEVDSRQEVDAALDRLVAMHVDFVKLTDNTLKPDLFRYALGEIRRRGLKSSAHIPAAVPVREAILLGLGSIEHLSYAIRAGAERPGGATPADPMAAFDQREAVAVYRLMAQHGTAITPTLNISRTLAWLDSEDHRSDSYLQYIGPGLQQTYAWRVQRAASADSAAIARRHANYTFTAAKLPLLQQAGVLILAGTDAGFLNSYDYPGVGLHDEMALMVRAGLTPLQALQAATVNGARFLGREGRHGTLETGHVADVVLLDADPTQQIEATRRIRGVVLRGEYLDRGALDDLLEDTAADVKAMTIGKRP